MAKVLGASSAVPLHCEKCDTRWTCTFALPMEMAAFTRMLRRTVCPSCGTSSRRIVFETAARRDTFSAR